MGKLNWAKQACLALLLYATTAIALPAQSFSAPQSGSITAVVPNETIALPAQTFTTLHSFDGADGNGPYAGLVQGTDGNLYGTTAWGGETHSGTVFKITPSGMLTTLYSFCSQLYSFPYDCPDGDGPEAGLVQATDGNFYGAVSCDSGIALCFGTVFKITPAGTLTTLHGFGGTDGTFPLGTLVQATDGNFYGTTFFGGAYNDNYCGDYFLGCGTVFKITPSGSLTTLYSFCSQGSPCTDGAGPNAGLVQAADGNLYGTTTTGGGGGRGTVFKITPGGTLTTLYSFCSLSNCRDGSGPNGALVQATDGNFYGTTYIGGAYNYGTVFKVTPSGTLTTLHSFDGTEGGDPHAALVQGTDGNFYGTTYYGANGYGTVFKITPGGRLATLYRFCSQPGCTDGTHPYAGLVQDTNGKFYGAACGADCGGGTGTGYGTVFSLSVGLGPFVETQPTSGKVGAAVEILGTDLTEATSVTFNGTPAPFKVVSSSQITTDVPAGATTGKVQVVTPSGTLLSNVPFQVLPSLRFSPMSPGGDGGW